MCKCIDYIGCRETFLAALYESGLSMYKIAKNIQTARLLDAHLQQIYRESGNISKIS